MAQLQVVNVTTDATVASGANAATALTGYSFDCGGASLLLVLAEANSGSGNVTDITGITYGGTALTRAGRVQWATSNACLADVWYLLDPAAGSNTVAITVTSAALIGWFSGAMSFTGHARKTPIRNTTFTATGNDTAPIVQVSGSARGNLLVDICGTGSGFTGNGNNKNWTLNVNGNSAGNNAASQTAGSGGSVTHGYAVTSDMWGILVVEVLAASDEAENTSPDVLLDAYGPFHAAGTAFQGSAFEQDAFQVLGGTTGGPATYNEAVDATALAQDQLATTQVMNASLAESALAQDALATAQSSTASLSASALAQDVLATIQIMTASEAPSALAQDQLATQQVMLASESESATAAEQFATAQIMLASLSERALAQDVAIGVLQIPIGFSEASLADVLFDAALAPAGGGNTFNEAVSEGALAKDSVDAGLQIGSGIEAKIGGAGAGTSIFVFDD